MQKLIGKLSPNSASVKLYLRIYCLCVIILYFQEDQHQLWRLKLSYWFAVPAATHRSLVCSKSVKRLLFKEHKFVKNVSDVRESYSLIKLQQTGVTANSLTTVWSNSEALQIIAIYNPITK